MHKPLTLLFHYICKPTLTVTSISAYSVQYLFLKHPPLEFSQTLYGIYEGWSMLLTLSVNGFFVPLLKKRFNLPDMPLLIIAIITHALSAVVMALSTHAWMVFTGKFISHNLQITLFFMIYHFPIKVNKCFIKATKLCIELTRLSVR